MPPPGSAKVPSRADGALPGRRLKAHVTPPVQTAKVVHFFSGAAWRALATTAPHCGHFRAAAARRAPRPPASRPQRSRSACRSPHFYSPRVGREEQRRRAGHDSSGVGRVGLCRADFINVTECLLKARSHKGTSPSFVRVMEHLRLEKAHCTPLASAHDRG